MHNRRIARQSSAEHDRRNTMMKNRSYWNRKFSLRVALKLRLESQYYNWGTNGHQGKHLAAPLR